MLSNPILVGCGLVASAIPVGVALYATFVPQSRIWGPTITRGTPPRICLTFDDGPTPGYTAQVLQILGRAGVPATFFVIGCNAQRSPSLLSEIHAAGHLIGNHSYDHHHFGLFGGRQYWIDKLRRTDDIVAKATGRRPALFRPPIGFKTPFIFSAVRHTGHTVVTWSVRAFEGRGPSTDLVCQRIATRARPGDIVILHDGTDPHSPRPHTPEVAIRSLPAVLQQLQSRGLGFTSLDAALGRSAYASISSSAGAAGTA